MSEEIKITSNKAESLAITGLGELTEKVKASAAKGLARGLILATTVIQTDFMSGPRPGKLDAISGRLRGSMISKVVILADRVRGSIGTTVPYGAYHEFGFHGTEQVKAHTRTVAVLDVAGQPIEIRRAIRDAAGNILGFKQNLTQEAKHNVRAAFVFSHEVRAHTRKVNYAGRPFIRPGLTKASPMILAEIKAELAALKPSAN